MRHTCGCFRASRQTPGVPRWRHRRATRRHPRPPRGAAPAAGRWLGRVLGRASMRERVRHCEMTAV